MSIRREEAPDDDSSYGEDDEHFTLGLDSSSAYFAEDLAVEIEYKASAVAFWKSGDQRLNPTRGNARRHSVHKRVSKYKSIKSVQSRYRKVKDRETLYR